MHVHHVKTIALSLIAYSIFLRPNAIPTHESTAKKKLRNKPPLEHAMDNALINVITTLSTHQAKQLCLPIRNGDLATLQALTEGKSLHQKVLQARMQGGNTLLHVACDAGHHSMVAWLLDQGADVSQRNDNQDTPLHVACSNKTKQSRTQIARELLHYNALAQVVNAQKRTPLMLAIRATDAALVKTLLKAGAETYNVDAQRETVLHMAARAGNITIAFLLSRAKACSTQRNGDGKLPFELAADHNHPEVAQLLKTAYVREIVPTLPRQTLLMLRERMYSTISPTPSERTQRSHAGAEPIMHDNASCATSIQSRENSSTTSERENISLTPSIHSQTTQTESDHQSGNSGLTSYTLVSNDPVDIISLPDCSTVTMKHA